MRVRVEHAHETEPAALCVELTCWAIESRGVAVVPRSNQALTLFQLERIEEAEKLTRKLIRRDPMFRDGQALLATLRYEQSDVAGAARAITDLCSGADGAAWCSRYSSVDVVTGRWSPRAVAAYRRLLDEPSIRLELRNGQGGAGAR